MRYTEITLLGQNVNSYNYEGKNSLNYLILSQRLVESKE